MATPSLTLYTLGGAFGLRSVSPFCLKLELLLEHLKLPHSIEVESDPRKAPKGKLPFMKFGDEVIADSELIVARLDALSDGGVYRGLDARQQAYGLGLTRLAEEHLYWIMVASRWLDDDWWPNIVEGFFHIAPPLLRPLAAGAARRQVRNTYRLQGLGLHSRAEEESFARRDLQALSDATEGSAFLFGDEPNLYDFAIVGLLAGLYDQQPGTWLNPIAEEYPSLKAYADRVQEHVGVFGRK